MSEEEQKKKGTGINAVCNKFCMIGHLVMALILSGAYVLEFIRGTKTIGYMFIIMILALVPVAADFIFYKKDPHTTMIKHMMGYGFGIFYIFIMFTTDNHLAFVYTIPMILLVSTFGDSAYNLKVGVGCFIVNVLQDILYVSNGTFTKAEDIEIQIALMFLVMVFCYMSARVVGYNNKCKLLEVNKAKEDTEQLLNKTVNVSSQMISDIHNISDQIAILNESVTATQEAMGEVNTGSTDTADAVQKQLQQTEDIQNKIQIVSDGSQIIVSSMNDTKQAIETGNQNVDTLLDHVEESVQAGKDVTTQLASLDDNMQQMNSIVDIINEITSQTSLLALNASIEAARAGDAGRGFAVVASEISKMADQTQQATVNITDLITNVSEAIQKVVHVSSNMITLIEGQNELADKTAKSFTAIDNHSQKVYEQSQKLQEVVSALAQANKEIIDSISTISAISEEVAAHANDTYDASDKNKDIVAETSSCARRLIELAGQLNA